MCDEYVFSMTSIVITKYHAGFDKEYNNGIYIWHQYDVIMGAMASQIASLAIVYSTVYSGANQRKHQSSASLAFVWGFHRSPVNSPHKWPVTRKMFPFDDVIMDSCLTDPATSHYRTDDASNIPSNEGYRLDSLPNACINNMTVTAFEL